MKSWSIWTLSLAGVMLCSAQVDFPGNPLVGPKKYTKREVGGGAEPGASVESPTGSGMARYVTHVILYDTRFWTSVEGKPLAGKLVAFEDLVVTAPKGAPVPPMPAPPVKPTVVQDGNVRLLVDRKPVVVPLARLSWQDRELIDGIQAALDKKAAEGR
ncbi:hypothetical protein OVA24_08105 [Luteolibacter sp. SL250]|uniref:hypothetical protein n=1 Tax=Luteolibacter sp. SL250 TaxID=2995170 RepID=UPI002271C7EF|nr:hypothetical protein [Luteolibacter sp. SL250]WAC21347.1 hypothetical protein OVA24_08105 [Luteolibacter sp. SL250]